jgi:hypothetical protein
MILLFFAAAGALLGAASRAVGLHLSNRGRSNLVAWSAQCATAWAIMGVIIGPSLWAARTPSQACMGSMVNVTLAGQEFAVPMIAPFVVQRIEGQFKNYDFDDRRQLNAFCDLRAWTSGSLTVTEIGVYMQKVTSDQYSSMPVETDLVKKKQRFCEATQGRSWPDPVCRDKPALPMPRSVIVRGTLGSQVALLGRHFPPSADNEQCRLGGNEWRCMFDEAWHDISGTAYELTDRSAKSLPGTNTSADLPYTRRTERLEHEDFVKYAITSSGGTDGHPWSSQTIYMELNHRQDFDGRNLVYRCQPDGTASEPALSCAALHRIERQLFLQYDFTTSEADFAPTAMAVDTRIHLMLRELRKYGDSAQNPAKPNVWVAWLTGGKNWGQAPKIRRQVKVPLAFGRTPRTDRK